MEQRPILFMETCWGPMFIELLLLSVKGRCIPFTISKERRSKRTNLHFQGCGLGP